MTPPRTRQAATSATDAPSKPLPEQWTFDVDEMTALEKDVAMRAVGATASTLDKYVNSYMAACAVVLARRDRPDIPVDTWKQLKGRDITTVEPADLDNVEGDPTPPL